MSRSRSTSLEIVPPTSSRARPELADVMDSAFKNNHNQDEDDGKEYDDADAEAEVDEIDDQAPTPKVGTASSNGPNAPTPCERCQRTGKPCKGVAGSRCEHCKRLKQKCSNSSGPARGKNASVKKPADSVSTPKGTTSKPAGPPVGTPLLVHNLKRKFSPTKGSPAQNGDADGSLDGEGSVVDDDNHDPPARLTKKRRVSKGAGGPSRAQLVKAVNDMEASIKRIQASVGKEVEKMSAIVKALNAKIREMDEE
ncbi:hypothetical protein GALMADRAFT_235485 [Galerina marginata CBS 339.88]|uniref:Zn(2)-C6 fungal-type domain-containing protein n=1 Tax=Galerina marginata (strain CBS 339.88) TaxID=685588 RepID=A0A067TM17_GALM3|nr:hypothetical protein GALMADRAFT_235485 [Galerina marginata CBS 339.88]